MDVTHARKAPLDGVRVLDLTRLLPGPMCSLYLADLGADVIKIEDTREGDYARGFGRPGEPAPFFRAINRNKRSCALDLKDPRGHDVFMTLARTCDVVVEGFRPGVVQALGIDAAAVHAVAPRVVYASISGHGQTGPRAHAAGHDINYLACAGALDQIGAAGGAPALSNLQIADLLGGAAMPAVAICAALLDAERTGRGRAIDVAMTDAMLAHMIFPLQALALDGRTRARGTDLLTGGVACYGVYRTQDGRHLAVGALEPKFWTALCTALARPDLVPLGRAQGPEGERARAELAAILAQAPLAAWMERLAGVDCCVTPVATLEEALADPQFATRGMVIADPEGGLQFAPPFKISDAAFAIRRTAPAHGQHTREVLREIGVVDAAIDALVQDGVVRVSAAS